MNRDDTQLRPYALKDGDGWKYKFGIDFLIKVGEVGVGSNVAVMEYITRQGEEPGGHTHPSEDEMFYILEGTLTFQCGNEKFDLGKGGFIFLPHGVKHSYTIQGVEPVHMIVITAPKREQGQAGWGGFVSDIELGQGELISKPHL